MTLWLLIAQDDVADPNYTPYRDVVWAGTSRPSEEEIDAAWTSMTRYRVEPTHKLYLLEQAPGVVDLRGGDRRDDPDPLDGLQVRPLPDVCWALYFGEEPTPADYVTAPTEAAAREELSNTWGVNQDGWTLKREEAPDDWDWSRWGW